jgi:hypothetical protein
MGQKKNPTQYAENVKITDVLNSHGQEKFTGSSCYSNYSLVCEENFL